MTADPMLQTREPKTREGKRERMRHKIKQGKTERRRKRRVKLVVRVLRRRCQKPRRAPLHNPQCKRPEGTSIVWRNSRHELSRQMRHG